VSRRHARLVRREGRYILEDLSSYIGTKVNGARISGSVPLNDGDQVGIGDYRLAIRADRPGTVMGLPASVPIGAAAGAHAAPPPGASASTAAAAAVAAVAAMSAPAAGGASAHRADGGRSHHPGAPPGRAGGRPETTLETPVAAMPPARLLVMTQPLSGQEFILDRASLVIGRTQENDIVLNHKSISRHHAKVIRDGDRYVVVDLESANGVRVNGVEYERVELQSGDVVELGHVRLRFATADDPGVFESRFVPTLAARATRSCSSVWRGGGRHGRSGPGMTGEDVRETRNTTSAQTVAPAPSALTGSAARLLQQAKDAYKGQKWAEALVLVARAAAVSPGCPKRKT